MRLARHGKKGYPVYHIVVADSRSPRDGKFIEKLGIYNPNTHPATIELSVDGAVAWLNKGAQPTDTCKYLLSEKGALMKKHLLGGVAKGAFTMEEAEIRFDKWLGEKEAQAAAKVASINESKSNKKAARLAEEQKLNNARIEAIAKKKADAAKAKEAPAEGEAAAE
ncbi:MAG: 30S ribosomal protein S16 [Rikenellaceae bacterium]